MKRHLGQLIALLCGIAMFLASLFYQEPSRISGVREAGPCSPPPPVT